MRALTAVLVAALALSMPVPVAAESATESCETGPASQASANRPHQVDPSGDTNLGSAALPGGQDAYDFTKVWVSQEDAPPPGEIATFAVNLQVTDLREHPVNAVFYVNYSPFEWVSAKALLDGSWEFRWGNHPSNIFLVGVSYQVRGTTVGRVDAAQNLVSIQLPVDRLPEPRLDGREIRLEQLFVSTGSHLGAPTDAAPAMQLVADNSFNAQRCGVVLYPKREEG